MITQRIPEGDPLNVKAGADQILYGLANFGILKKEYANIAETPDSELDEKALAAKQDLREAIQLFISEVYEYGEILGEKF